MLLPIFFQNLIFEVFLESSICLVHDKIYTWCKKETITIYSLALDIDCPLAPRKAYYRPRVSGMQSPTHIIVRWGIESRRVPQDQGPSSHNFFTCTLYTARWHQGKFVTVHVCQGCRYTWAVLREIFFFFSKSKKSASYQKKGGHPSFFWYDNDSGH